MKTDISFSQIAFAFGFSILVFLYGAHLFGYELAKKGDGINWQGRYARVAEEHSETNKAFFDTCENAAAAARDAGVYDGESGGEWFWNWWFTDCGFVDRPAPPRGETTPGY